MSKLEKLVEFDKMLLQRAEWLKDQGVKIPTYPKKRVFPLLDEEVQSKSLSRLKTLCRLIDLFPRRTSESDKLKAFCKKNNLKPGDRRVFNKVDDSTCWEIVTFDLQQLYRSSMFYVLTGYSLEELETYPPWELWRRPEKVMQKLKEVTGRLLMEEKMIELNFVEPYIAEESLSEEKRLFELDHKYLCPVYSLDSSELYAFIAVTKVRRVDDPNKPNSIKIFD